MLAGCGSCREVDQVKPGPAAVAKAPRAPISAAKRPTLPPRIQRTVIAWSVAEARDTAADWEAAAEAYERELESCGADCNETVYAIVLARRNAMMAEPIAPPEGDAPVPLPPRVQSLVDALDHYAAAGAADDPDVAGVKFLAAHTMGKWRQPDAIARFEAVIREHPTAEVAEYAANLLLFTLDQQQRYADLRIWVDRLFADKVFLAGKSDLEETLRRMKTQLSMVQ